MKKRIMQVGTLLVVTFSFWMAIRGAYSMYCGSINTNGYMFQVSRHSAYYPLSGVTVIKPGKFTVEPVVGGKMTFGEMEIQFVDPSKKKLIDIYWKTCPPANCAGSDASGYSAYLFPSSVFVNGVSVNNTGAKFYLMFDPSTKLAKLLFNSNFEDPQTIKYFGNIQGIFISGEGAIECKPLTMPHPDNSLAP